jgi:hypothetical protein
MPESCTSAHAACRNGPKPGKLAMPNHPCGQRQRTRAKRLLGSRHGEHHDHHDHCHLSEAHHVATILPTRSRRQVDRDPGPTTMRSVSMLSAGPAARLFLSQ